MLSIKGNIILDGLLTSTKSYGAETMTIITANPEKDNGDPMEQITKYNNDPSWDDEILHFAHYSVSFTFSPLERANCY